MLYAAAIVIPALLGHYGLVGKTAVVPAAIVAAAATRRFRTLVREWAMFAALVLLFDSLRGLVYALVTRFDLPVHVNYVIDAEHALLGGRTLPLILQQAWFDPPQVGFLERFLVVIHASHFVVFFLFGLLVWLTRPTHFRRFKLGILLVLGVGILAYLAIPTVPPWMAYESYAAIPQVHHVASQVYTLTIPALERMFNINPIAAMPSLHAAFPTMLSLVAVHHFRWKALPVVVYTLLVCLAITYLGEHYLLDVVAGIVLAGGPTGSRTMLRGGVAGRKRSWCPTHRSSQPW